MNPQRLFTPLRVVFAVQFAVVASSGVAFRVAWVTGEAVPDFVDTALALLLMFSLFTFPAWGVVAARQVMKLRGGRLLAILVVELIMWYALWIAVLLGVI